MKEFFSQSYIAQLISRYVREIRDNEFEQALLRVLIGLVLIYYFRKSGFYRACKLFCVNTDGTLIGDWLSDHQIR